MAKCDYCQHVEMCGWRESLEERGCDFFDDGNKWIPVSERSPERGKQVLCCNKNGSVFTSCVTYRANGSGNAYFGKHNNVIAWMPLPEPYKAESEG